MSTLCSLESKVASLLRSIHKDPAYKDWISIETVVVQPVFFSLQNEMKMLALLAVPNGNNRYSVWAHICWRWENGTVFKMGDIRSQLNQQKVILDKTDLYNPQIGIGIADLESIDAKEDIIFGVNLSLKAKELYLNTIEKIVSGETNYHLQNKTKDFPSFMRELKELIMKIKSPVLMEEWSIVLRTFTRLHFTIAVVGQSNRGKSSLVNGLLGREVVPVSAISNTSVLTQISYGEKSEAMTIDSKGIVRKLSEQNGSIEEAMQAFDKDEQGGYIQVNEKNNRLKNIGARILDTPGIDDTIPQRVKTAIETIGNCDATLVVLSATMPLSLTEQNFIKEHIILKKVPQIGIVITHIDQVEENERHQVIKYLEKKIDAIQPLVQKFYLEPQEGKTLDYVYQKTAEKIWPTLFEWSQDPKLQEKRQRHSQEQLNWLIDLISCHLQALKHLSQDDKSERQMRIEKEKNQLKKEELIWNEACIQLKEKHQQCQTSIQQTISLHGKRVLENVQGMLSRCPDPKEWLETEFVSHIEKSGKDLFDNLCGKVDAHIGRDCFEIREMISKRLAESIKFEPIVHQKKPSESTNADFTEMAYVKKGILGKKSRHIIRLASIAGGMVLTPILIPFVPTAAIAQLLGGTIGFEVVQKCLSNMIQEKKESQGAIGERIASSIIEEQCRIIRNAISEDARDWYLQFENELQERKRRWIAAKQSAITQLETGFSEDSQVDQWEEALQQIIQRLNGG